MTGDGPVPLRIEEWPDPACRFAVEDGTARLRAVNDPFEAAFGTAETDEPVATTMADLGVSPVSADGFEAILAGEGPVRVRTDGETAADGRDQRYLARTVRPDPDGEGVLVFTPLPETDDGSAAIDVDHVASVVSHDLRNPLDVAKARLRAGRETGDDGHFERVADAHDRMERIIRDVLTLARGRDVVDPDETVSLGAVAESAWETVETDDATLSVDGPLPTTTADADRVGRLFENLFRNAVEHGSTNSDADTETAADPVTVTVGPLEGDREGFYVEDDGPGIPEAERERVFEPGYSTDDHGTGLGLAIADRIAALHGWSITATASDASGARFEVTGIEPETP